MALKGIAHVCIGASNLEATRQFYIDGLGCRKVFDFIRSDEVFGYYLEVAPGTFIEVFRQERIEKDAPAPIRHLCLEVDDLDAIVTRLRQYGYEASDKKLGADQSWQAWTTDPGGVRIEFHQYTPNSSQRTSANCVLR